jgi:hypothetical protein
MSAVSTFVAMMERDIKESSVLIGNKVRKKFSNCKDNSGRNFSGHSHNLLIIDDLNANLHRHFSGVSLCIHTAALPPKKKRRFRFRTSGGSCNPTMPGFRPVFPVRRICHSRRHLSFSPDSNHSGYHDHAPLSKRGDPMEDQIPPMEDQIPPMPGTTPQMSQTDFQHEINVLKSHLKVLEERIVSTERRQAQLPVIPQTNLLSGSFLTRAFAVLGHYTVASLIITIPLFIVIFIIAIAISLSFTGM